MIVELSPVKILPQAITVWSEQGPGVDIVMDLRNLTFAENSLTALYTYHVLDHLFPEEIDATILNWKKCLAVGAKIFFIVDDFEYVSRAFVGGDIDIFKFNAEFTRPTNFTKDNILNYLSKAGFPEGVVSVWFTNIPDVYNKKHHELIISATKL